jgi:squalene synthase HpnC
MRPHVAAVYAFARIADDLADEGTASPETRQAQLRAWQGRLHDTLAVGRDGGPSETRDDLVFIALGHSIRSLDLPVSLFDDLLSAFGQDTMTTRYASWSDLLDYCRRSANPIGRLVLRIAGYRDEALDRSSDALCTALQLTNFWQDFGRDWNTGRLYVPREVYESCGARESELNGGQMPAGWTRAIDTCVRLTRDTFHGGLTVCNGVSGRLRFELRLTWLGGQRVLDRVHAAGPSLFLHRPALGAGDVPGLLWRAVRWGGQAA